MKPLQTVKSASDDSEAQRCPDCLNWFRVSDEFPASGNFVTTCPHCLNEIVFYEENK